MSYIGIDLGTSAVKLLLVGEDGKVIKSVTRKYPIDYPQPGWSEQNPEDWLAETLEGLKALAQCPESAEVKALSVAGQMHGLVLMDKEDKVLRPAILWNDGRSTKETDYLNETVGKDFLSKHTGNIAFAGFTAPKVLWVKNNEPELFAKVEKICLPKDYLIYKLTGNFSTDVSDASGTLYFDVENRKWSEEMLQICGITEEQVPTVYESYEAVGKVKSEICQAVGLPEDIVVAAGAGDNAAAAVGAGTVGNGRCNISLGTSGTIFMSADSYHVDPNNALHSFDHSDGNWHLMGCILSAASCNQWWMENILHSEDYAGEQKEIDITKPGGGLLFLPYLMGERTPHNDPMARGAFVGLSMSTTRAEMTRAIFEGVAFAIRDSLEVAKKEAIPIERSTVCGGGAKSKLWCEILANVLNITIDTTVNEEGPAMGAVMLAAVACGDYDSVKTVSEQFCRRADSYVPEKEIAARYEKEYECYRKLYPALKEMFRELTR